MIVSRWEHASVTRVADRMEEADAEAPRRRRVAPSPTPELDREDRVRAHSKRIAATLVQLGELADEPGLDPELALERSADRFARRPWHSRLAKALARLAAKKGSTT